MLIIVQLDHFEVLSRRSVIIYFTTAAEKEELKSTLAAKKIADQEDLKMLKSGFERKALVIVLPRYLL